jgi:hypothetical protein
MDLLGVVLGIPTTHAPHDNCGLVGGLALEIGF